MSQPLWPHQTLGVRQSLEAVFSGHKRICLTSPTGGGKTRMMAHIIREVVYRNWCVSVNTSRKILVEQLESDLAEEGIPYGVRAAGKVRGCDEAVQICSLPTERSKVMRQGIWEPHGKGRQTLAIIDEVHVNRAETAQQIAASALEDGGALLGITATPIGLFPFCTKLIVAGTNSELRACGALVPAHHYGCDEPDLAILQDERKAMPAPGTDPSEKQQRRLIMTPTIFGRVLHWWQRLNPEQLPTILCGPGKPEALFFAEQFHAAGISAAHLDGEIAWINGQVYRTEKNVRKLVAELSRTGEVKIVTNRFVLREGVNWPWISHLILAFVAGSLQTYLQIGGRGLRACPGKTHLTVQDHGGAWHRHGSLNADQSWDLETTAAMHAALRLDRLRHPKPGDAPQPGLCPQCRRVLNYWKCPCGWQMPAGSKRSRPVVEIDGQLRELVGDVYRPRRISKRPDADKLWERMYHRARSERWDATFLQAEAMFAQENNWTYPPRDLPFMPVDEAHMVRKVRDLRPEQLIPKQPQEAMT